MTKFLKPMTVGLALVAFAVTAGCEQKTPAEKVADGVKDGVNNVETKVENATN